MIGIFGGTFDPIHYGHLRIALEVLQAHQLSQVRFIPLNIAVHRKQPETPQNLRLQMLKKAIVDVAEFSIDERELIRNKPSYSIDTLKSLATDFPHHSFCLMMGMDSFNTFSEWKQPDEILQYCHLMVMSRPDSTLVKAHPYQSHITNRKQALKETKAGYIFIQQVSALSISSTQIRQSVQKKEIPHYLLPPACIKIIKANNLY